MKRKIVLFDMDGVLCDYNKRLLELAHTKLSLPLYKQEDIATFETQCVFPEEYHDAVDALSSEQGFYESLEPVTYAIEAFHEIANENINGSTVDIFICTSPKRFKKSPYSLREKSEWVKKYLGEEFVDRIIFTRDKTLINGDILIDDKPVQAGVHTPAWTHVYYDRPYNKLYDRPRVLSWKTWKRTLLPLLQIK